MSEAAIHVSEATMEAPDEGPRGRTRTCVGCTARVDADGPEGADLVRLVLGPEGVIAVDGGSRRGGGFGRGAHVHARRACLERAARAGLPRVSRGEAKLVADAGEGDKPEALSADSLARAIQRSMDRRIEGLLAAAVRSRQVARGADAVTGACRRGDAQLVVVARDAAAAADLTEVRLAVAEGRAVAWGTKERLGAIVAPPAVRSTLPAVSTLENARERSPTIVENARERSPTIVENARERSLTIVENARERSLTIVENAQERSPTLHGEARERSSSAAGSPGGGVGVVAISSRSLAAALRQAVATAEGAIAGGAGGAGQDIGARSPRGASSSKRDERRRSAGLPKVRSDG